MAVYDVCMLCKWATTQADISQKSKKLNFYFLNKNKIKRNKIYAVMEVILLIFIIILFSSFFVSVLPLLKPNRRTQRVAVDLVFLPPGIEKLEHIKRDF